VQYFLHAVGGDDALGVAAFGDDVPAGCFVGDGLRCGEGVGTDCWRVDDCVDCDGGEPAALEFVGEFVLIYVLAVDWLGGAGGKVECCVGWCDGQLLRQLGDCGVEGGGVDDADNPHLVGVKKAADARYGVEAWGSCALDCCGKVEAQS